MNIKRPSVIVLASIALLLLSGAASFESSAQDAPIKTQVAFRNALTHAELEPSYEKSKQDDPILGLGQDPTLLAAARAYSQESLLDRSQAVSHNGLTILLPKGSVLSIPDAMASRMVVTEGTRIVSWAEFYRANSQWILPVNVRLEQALGKETLDPNLLIRLAKSGKAVVATYFDNPISIQWEPVEGSEEKRAK